MLIEEEMEESKKKFAQVVKERLEEEMSSAETTKEKGDQFLIWAVTSLVGASEDEIKHQITDGSSDMGIDAWIKPEIASDNGGIVQLFQSKYGESHDESEILKFQMPAFLGGPEAPADSKGLGLTNLPLLIGAGASVLLGVFSIFLPNTPPKMKGQSIGIGDVLGFKAMSLMKDKSFAVFIICSLLICIPLSFYYQSANGYLKAMDISNSEGVLALGQVSEIFFLLLVPFLLIKLGVKRMLLIGMAFWVLRYLFFAAGSQDAQYLLFLGVIAHGICYDFFFFTGQLYVDKKAPADIRSQAQGFIAFVTLGVGMFIGGNVNGWWTSLQTHEKTGVINWDAVWYFPAAMAAAVLVAFYFLFNESKSTDSTEATIEEPPTESV